eukprot:gene10898-16762_t
MAAVPASKGASPRVVGLLIVDHGSKRAQSNEELVQTTQLVKSAWERRAGRGDPSLAVVTKYAHMEIASPSIDDAVRELARGHSITELRVVPYFLSRGKHVSFDIPALVKAACDKHGVQRYSIAGPLGVDSQLADLLLQRAGLR